MAGIRFNKLFRAKDDNQIEQLLPVKLLDTVWDDLRAPATAINPPGQASDPDWDAIEGGWLFDAASTEVLFVIMQFPHTYKEGSNIRPHVHWEPTDANSGNVVWRMEYKWYNVNGTRPGSWTQEDITDAADGTSGKHQIAAFTEIDGTGMGLSSLFVWKISRIGGDASDTYGVDARMMEIDIHFQVDTPGGSYDEYSKS